VKPLKLFLLLLVVSTLLIAQKIEVISEARTLTNAKEDALVSLSNMIKAEVHSDISQSISDTNGEIDKRIQSSTQIVSDLPMIGVTYTILKGKQENQEKKTDKLIRVKASMDSSISLPLYMKLINEYTQNLNKLCATDISLYTLKEKRNFYNKQLTKLHKLQKYQVVAFFLGHKNFTNISTDEHKILFNLSELNIKAETLSQAVAIFTDFFHLSNKSTLIEFAKYQNSLSATEFAKDLQSALEEFTNYNDSTYRQYKLRGKYTLLEDGNIFITYKLYNRNDKFLKEKSVYLNSKNFSKEDLLPRTYCLEFKHSPHCFGSRGWKKKFQRTLKSLHINYRHSCKDATKFTVYLKHKNSYSPQLGARVNYFNFDIKLKNKNAEIIAQQKRTYTYANQNEEDFNYELSEIEPLDTNLQDTLINMLNRD